MTLNLTIVIPAKNDAARLQDCLAAVGSEFARSVVVIDSGSTDQTAAVAAERDRIVGRIRDCADEMAGQLHRVEGGEYGTWTTTVDGTRWELKRDGDRAAYLRVGGEDGIYLLSQYAPPSAVDVRALAPDVADFVASFNDHVEGLASDLGGVSLSE